MTRRACQRASEIKTALYHVSTRTFEKWGWLLGESRSTSLSVSSSGFFSKFTVALLQVSYSHLDYVIKKISWESSNQTPWQHLNQCACWKLEFLGGVLLRFEPFWSCFLCMLKLHRTFNKEWPFDTFVPSCAAEVDVPTLGSIWENIYIKKNNLWSLIISSVSSIGLTLQMSGGGKCVDG